MYGSPWTVAQTSGHADLLKYLPQAIENPMVKLMFIEN